MHQLFHNILASHFPAAMAPRPRLTFYDIATERHIAKCDYCDTEEATAPNEFAPSLDVDFDGWRIVDGDRYCPKCAERMLP